MRFFTSFWILLIILFSTHIGWGQATLPFTKTNWSGTAQTGYTNSGLNHRTSSQCSNDNSAGTFDDTGDFFKINFDSEPDQVKFWLKKQTMSGQSKVVIEASVDDNTYTIIG